MLLNFSPAQCCDADDYLSIGEACARTGSCWGYIRPIGAALYFSLPFRLGIEPRFIILLNLALIALSAVLAGRVIGGLFEFPSRSIRWLCAFASATSAHLIFLYGDAWTSLSDVPAACILLIGFWTLMLGALQRKSWLVCVSGLMFGLSVFIRLFYVYSATAAWVAFAMASWRKGVATKTAVATMGLLMAIPVMVQLYATYRHEGHWSLLSRGVENSQLSLLMNEPYAGYDTVAHGAYPYIANDCLKEPGTFSGILEPAQLTTMGKLSGALRKGDYAGVACVFLRKQKFYFASYAGHTYLLSPNERSFWPGIGLLHALVIVFLARAIIGSRFKAVFLAPVACIGIVWISGSLIIPDSRYLAAFYVFAWSMGLSAIFSALSGFRMRS